MSQRKQVSRAVVKQSSVDEICDTTSLRRMLVDTIAGVRSKRIDHKEARSIVSLAQTILDSAKLDLIASKLIGGAQPPMSLRLT